MPIGPGTRLGHYEIGPLLGAGGMGEVYRARDLTLPRDVALKVLPPGLDDPAAVSRFDREGHLLASLNHPHIASIYEVVDTGRIRAIVMELIEGTHSPIASRVGPCRFAMRWPSPSRSAKRSRRRTRKASCTAI